MVKKLCGTILSICLSCCFAIAQIDTEFWFAAPEVTLQHAEVPVFFRISSQDKPATITISQPANSSFPAFTRHLAANQTISIDLQFYLSFLENDPPNTILNKGILLKSTAPVTAYYEVLGSVPFGAQGVNSDIFVLKGDHALGTEFYTPFQTHWDNYPNINAWSSFDIVATQDNTTITITPTKDVVGHTAGIPYTIVLDKGQTYSARSVSNLAAEHPAGSYIVSDKPIAVTVKDDSMFESGSWDLGGDQLVPVTVLGKEYIAIRMSILGNTDRLYIMATNPSTQIFLDGNETPVATLNAGESFEYQMSNPSAYITASDSVYVWHTGGLVNELAGAILPPLGCTGSRAVSFTRSTIEDFYLVLLIRSGYENYFELNGNGSLIPASAFNNVTGSGGVWKYAKIGFSAFDIVEGTANLVTNDSSDFHLGTLNGGPSTGFRYGYFSDFGFLELGEDISFCKGDSATLDAGFGKSSYVWSTGETTQTITVADTGEYTVTVTKGIPSGAGCTFTDSVHVSYYPEITTPVLGADTAYCGNVDYKIKTVVTYEDYKWDNGSDNASRTPNSSGTYWVIVENEYGCKKGDSIDITLYPVPEPKILYNKDLDGFCKDSTVHLQSNEVFDTYLWSTGETTSAIITTHNRDDHYTLEVSNSFGCMNKTATVIDCSVIIGLIPNLITQNDDGKNDLFFIEYLREDKYIFEVFNGWGDRVYLNEGYDNTFDGKGLADGIYYYSLRHVEGKKEFKGWVQIIH